MKQKAVNFNKNKNSPTVTKIKGFLKHKKQNKIPNRTKHTRLTPKVKDDVLMRQSEARTVYTREQANAGENNQGQNRQRHTGGGKKREYMNRR